MRLEIEPDEMKIVTETIQDVAYLQHMGAGAIDSEMMLKVVIHRTRGQTLPAGGGIEISIKWEHEWADCEKGTHDVSKTFMQSARSYNIHKDIDSDA